MLRQLIVIFFISNISATSTIADLYSVDIRRIDPDFPVDATLFVEKYDADRSRTTAAFRIEAPNFFAQADAIGRAKGNMGSSRNRLYWVGPTRFTGTDGGWGFTARSRARYESWTYVELIFDTLKTKNFQDTKTVDLAISPTYQPTTGVITIEYKLLNIRNFPGELEQILRWLGVEFSNSTTIKMHDLKLARDVSLRLEGLRMSSPNGGAGLTAHIVVSFDTAAALRLGVKNFITFPEGGPLALMPRLFGGRG